jgi:hypothetical protein
LCKQRKSSLGHRYVVEKKILLLFTRRVPDPYLENHYFRIKDSVRKGINIHRKTKWPKDINK